MYPEKKPHPVWSSHVFTSPKTQEFKDPVEVVIINYDVEIQGLYWHDTFKYSL